MKKYIAFLLVVCLLLCATGCGKKPDPTLNTTESTQETDDSTRESTEVTEPPVLYRNPLNGEPLSEPWSGQVTAVMINNLRDALPQCGIGSADVFYEIEVEGDITRCLALFTDLSDVGVIGPIRSARTAFNSVAVSFDAPLIHCGGSQGLALSARYGATMDTIANWEHIDQTYNGDYFYRDTDRYKNGYSWEHTLFSTGELLQKAMNAKGYNTPTDKSFGLEFSDEAAVNGSPATEITVKFKFGKPSTFKYNAEKKEYTYFQHNREHIDGDTGEVVTFKNVIAIYTNQWYHTDGKHKFYDTIGSGDGYAAIDGQIVPIKWSRDSLRDSYTYTLEDGTPLVLGVGSTYVALVGIKHPISYK